MRSAILAGGLLLAGFQGVFAANIVTDFSSTQNPNGSYQYGQETTLGGTFTNLEQQISGSGYAGYQSSSNPGAVIYGADGSVTGSGTVIYTPEYLNLGPAMDGAFAVLRYTVQTAGSYDVDGKFRGQDTHGVSTDVHVLFNSNLLDSSDFNADVNGTGDLSAKAFNIDNLYLNVGDTIDFAVGTGGNGYYFDNTGLQASITAATAAVPEPGLFGLVAIGLVGLFALRRKVSQ